MLNTYIKNCGSTPALMANNCNAHVEEYAINTNYDGNRAKVLINLNLDGNRKMYHYTLDNADLANMLNINSIQMPLDRRLKNDFKKRHQPKQYRIELPTPQLVPREPLYLSQPSSFSSDDTSSLMELLQSSSPDSYLSSPDSNEEFIVPITLDHTPHDRYTFTPKKRNLTLKTHRTHRVFKRPKSRTSSSRRRRSKSSRR